MKGLTIALILHLLIVCTCLQAQNPSYYGLKAHYGFIIPHSSSLEDISSSNPWGIEVDYSRLKINQKAWNNCNCYAGSGVSFSYFNYGNQDQLGNSYN